MDGSKPVVDSSLIWSSCRRTDSGHSCCQDWGGSGSRRTSTTWRILIIKNGWVCKKTMKTNQRILRKSDKIVKMFDLLHFNERHTMLANNWSTRATRHSSWLWSSSTGPHCSSPRLEDCPCSPKECAIMFSHSASSLKRHWQHSSATLQAWKSVSACSH